MSVLGDYYRKKVSKAFNTWSGKYEKEVVPKLVIRGYSYKELAAKITAELGLDNSKLVLELGVGTGVLGIEVKALCGAALFGLDISRGMIEESSRKEIYSAIVNSSAEFIVFRNGMFDAVYTAFMLHSVLNRKKTLAEIFRVLKPGGRAMLIDLFPLSRLPGFVNTIRGFFHSRKYEYGAPANYKSAKALENELKKAGFRIAGQGQLGKDKDYIHYYFYIQKGE